ncbi:MAG: arylesterase [Candidatus Didemnitutus sp.]|nr:arylesterase [Candidatus Didemnitutus sp.]
MNLSMCSKTPNLSESAKMFVGRRFRGAGRFAAWCLAVALATAAMAESRTMMFFGDSLTAGYGIDPAEAYPALIQERIDAAKPGAWRVINAGLSGETTAGGLRRLDWILRQPVDLFVIELGGNDGLRGTPLELTQANLQTMIDRLRAHNPRMIIVLAGMEIPTNMGPTYRDAFSRIYPELAAKNDLVLIPFLLEGVGGIPRLNLPDGIHPTAEGHRIVAETVWKILQPLL